MTIGQALRVVLREVGRLDDWLADQIDQWIVVLHWPERVWDDAGHVVGSVCTTCGCIPWPCAEYLKIDQRLTERERARAETS